MTTPNKPRRRYRAILIELVVVIVVILVLSLLVFPLSATRKAKVWPIFQTWNPAMTAARTAEARAEMSGLTAAIQQYNATYARFPISNAASNSLNPACPDFTFGTLRLDHWNKTPPQIVLNALNDANGRPLPEVSTPHGGGYQNCNAEIMAMLLDLTNYPNGLPTVNVDHRYNPQRLVFLTAKFVPNTTSPGVGTDGVYRDPWGTPYIITLNMNGDGRCRDAFYRLAVVSQITAGNPAGHNGLTNSVDANGNGDHYEAATTIMIWSFGPDRKIDARTNAVSGANQDNVISW